MSNLINKETGFEIATTPEKLPPLRNGYIRLIHQTSFNCAESLAENGLEGDIGKTGDSRTGEISEKYKRVAQIQTETAKTSSTRFSQVTRNR